MANNCEMVKKDGQKYVSDETDDNRNTETENLKEKKQLKEQYSENDRSNVAEVYDREGDLKKQNELLKEELEGSKESLIKKYEESMS